MAYSNGSGMYRRSASGSKGERAARERSQEGRVRSASARPPIIKGSLTLSPSLHKAIIYDADGHVIGEMDSRRR